MSINILKDAGWDAEKRNTFLFNTVKCRLRLKTHENCLRFDIVLLGKMVLFLEITTTKNYESILQKIVNFQNSITEKYEELLLQILKQEGINVYLCKYFQGQKYVLSLALDNLFILNKPNWIRIKNSAFNFYLGTTVKSQLLITPDNQLLAHQFLLNLVENNHPLFSSFSAETFLKTATLKDFFEEYSDVQPVFDTDGNIVDFQQGGDEWIFEILDLISPFLGKDTFITIQDDGAVFWKVVYHSDKVVYFREELKENKK